MLALLAAWPVEAEEARRPDVITLANGNIYHGTLSLEALRLKAPYGEVAVPTARLAALRQAGKTGVRLETRNGSRFTGSLMQDRLPFLRVGEPKLDIAAVEVVELVFGSRDGKPADLPPDLVEARNGDLFRAAVTADGFTLKTPAGPHKLARPAVKALFSEEGGKRAYAHTAEGEIVGELAESGLALTLPGGGALAMPVAEVAAVGLAVPAGALGMIPPAALPKVIRDGLRDGSPGPALVVLAGGPYLRGDLQGDGDFDEKPVKPVTLKPFALAALPVTFEEYDRYTAATGKPPADDRGFGRGRQPVINVSWDEAMDYVRWLSDQTGKRYRLPSDAEWEYAARGGTATRFWWGDTLKKGMANCGDCGSLWDGEGPARVGRFAPNPYGLYDMTGNVWQWTADCWNSTFVDAPSDGTPMDKPECAKRVYRGGAWSAIAVEMRSANRWREFPQRHGDDTGFRLARDLEP